MLRRWPDEAARAAYFAGFHAAQALIFERRGHSAKTHSGVHTELARLTVGESSFDAELRGFLGRAYNFKAAADYETGTAETISATRAKMAIETAKRFVDRIADLLSSNPPTRGEAPDES